jgi:hypothetical protein
MRRSLIHLTDLTDSVLKHLQHHFVRHSFANGASDSDKPPHPLAVKTLPQMRINEEEAFDLPPSPSPPPPRPPTFPWSSEIQDRVSWKEERARVWQQIEGVCGK